MLRSLMSLSVRQPWADFIVNGIKDVENRATDTKKRGILLIHASKTYDTDWTSKLSPDTLAIAKKYIARKMISTRGTHKMETGAIVGACLLTDATFYLRSMPYRSPWGQYDMCHWQLQKAIRFTRPLKIGGLLGIFRTGLKFFYQNIKPSDLKSFKELTILAAELGYQIPEIPPVEIKQEILCQTSKK